MPEHITVLIYPTGNFKINVVPDNMLNIHIECSITLRRNVVLIVDNKCVNQAWMSDNEVQYWTEKIKKLDMTSINTYKVPLGGTR